MSRYPNKKKFYNHILRNSITLSSIGYVDFKGKIKDELNKNNISKEDALLIVLDLIYNVAENNLDDFELIPFFISKRIRNVKEFNNEFEISDIDLKIKKFFDHNYDHEKGIVQDYVSDLEFKNNINNGIHLLNKEFINNISYVELDSKINIINETTKSKPKKQVIINKPKLNFDYLNKTDLCFILGLNPDLTYEKPKILRKHLIDDLSKLDLDYNKLKNATPKELKEYLEPLLEKERKQKISKKKLNDLISRVKSFNNKKFSEIISSKDEYLEIFNGIENNFTDFDNKDLKIFVSYHNYINKIELFKSIETDVNSKKELINQLHGVISDNYLNAYECSKIKDNFNEIYEVCIKINELPQLLKDKFLDEHADLKGVTEIFNDMDSYTTLSDTNEDNKIRIHNEQLLDKKINNHKEFFKDISDISKKRAIVLDEKNIRVVAGAGTGKTFTIQKKVKYLIEKMDVSPEKILCLCYTNKGAKDLDKKVNSDLNDAEVEVCTFHEFCRRVDRYCGGNKSTNRYLLDSVIRNYIKDISDDDEKISKLMEYFSYYIVPHDDREEVSTYNELLDYEEGLNLETLKSKYYDANRQIFSLNGEIVKSLGEFIIANYLFMHEIEYEYERNYKHSFADILERFLYSGSYLSLNKISDESNESIVKEFIENERRWERYNPDFYLPEYDIYLEHFGIGRFNNEKWLHPDYEKEIQEKILRHKMHGTTLIKTYYYYLAEGCLREKLERILKENKVVIGERNKKEVMDTLIATNNVEDYIKFNKLVKTFINIFEAKNRDKTDFDKFKEIAKSQKYAYTRKRQEIFFDIISDIYDIYSKKNSEDTIDHNREISNALELIQAKKFDKSYEYILIDEYQDINEIRCKLLQELQKNSNSKIFVVGDDWQSIYMFNGSDVNLFIDFEKYFPNSETIKLEENRRNPPKIIEISSNFIKKNTNQEYKNLRYYKQESTSNLHPIKIVNYNDSNKYEKRKNKILKLDAIFNHILENNSKKDLKVLLLGRTNNDINKLTGNALFKEKRAGRYRKIIYSKKRNLDITFMTIHQAKGLEYDEVILINFENHINGFPNQMDDDPLLSFVKSYEDYPYAEERRLLYVGLTRTLNNVYLLSPQFDNSIFINELIDDFNVKVLNLPIDRDMKYSLYEESDFFKQWEYYETNVPCPSCDVGKLTVMVNNFKGTKYIRCSEDLQSNSKHYDGGPIPYYYSKSDVKYIEKCPSCRGVLIRKGDILKCCLNSYDGCMETKELKLDKEDMEYDE